MEWPYENVSGLESPGALMALAPISDGWRRAIAGTSHCDECGDLAFFQGLCADCLCAMWPVYFQISLGSREPITERTDPTA